MTKLRGILATLVVSGLIAACAPMEQAPLVYTSGIQVGLHVGTGPDKTSPEINIGVVQIDAAYVPVAVAKSCARGSTATAQECVNDIYHLYLVNGDSVANNTAPLPPEQVKVAADAYIAASDVLKTAQQDYGAKSATVDKFKAENAANAATPPHSDTDVNSANQDQTAALTTQRAAEANLEAKRQALVELVTGGKGMNASDNQHDALSVFGTFDSNTTANTTAKSGDAGTAGTPAPSAGVVLGHTFSTGIAAQNLTRGQEIASTASSYAACLTAIHTLAPDLPTTNKDTAIQALVDKCNALGLRK